MAANFAESDNGSCPMVDRLRGEMVNIKQAKENAEKNNGIVSVPKAVTVNSSEDCEQSCCGNDNCTVYLFYPRPPTNPLNNEHKNYNCFFLNCRPESLCSLVNVSSKAEGAVVGIRELQGKFKNCNVCFGWGGPPWVTHFYEKPTWLVIVCNVHFHWQVLYLKFIWRTNLIIKCRRLVEAQRYQ